MKTFFGLFALSVLLSSCIYKHTDDSIDLSGQYRYIQDEPQVIIFHPTVEYKGGGVNVVPPKVLDYKYNDKYIIAKSLDFEDKQIKYWIINKTIKEVDVKYLDSIQFSKHLFVKKINLKL